MSRTDRESNYSLILRRRFTMLIESRASTNNVNPLFALFARRPFLFRRSYDLFVFPACATPPLKHTMDSPFSNLYRGCFRWLASLVSIRGGKGLKRKWIRGYLSDGKMIEWRYINILNLKVFFRRMRGSGCDRCFEEEFEMHCE